MKVSRSKRPDSAFTLVELLVVISLICILAGLSFTGIQGAMLSAKKLQAKNDMAQIANAVQFYYTEYGKYPSGAATPSGNDTVFGNAIGSSGNNKIISILRYKGPSWTDANSENPRQIRFLEPKLVGIKKGGVYDPLSGSTGDGNWYDPWGTQFLIFIDGDYANDITVSSCLSSLATGGKVPITVGVASVGYYYVASKQAVPEALSDAVTYSSKTVLLSWQ